MSTLKYKDPSTGEWTKLGIPVETKLKDIPVTTDTPEDVDVWIDPTDDGSDSFYTKNETDNLLDGYYTKAETDDTFEKYYTQAEVNALLAKRPNPNLLDNWYFGNPVDQRGGYVTTPETNAYYDEGLTNRAGPAYAYFKVDKISNTVGRYDPKDGNIWYVSLSDCVRGYTGTGYTIDRWTVATNSVLTISDDGIVFNVGASSYGYGSLQQLFEKSLIPGYTYTLSVLANGELHYKTGICKDSGNFINEVYLSGNSGSYFRMSKSVLELVAFGDANPSILAAKLELGTEQTLAHQDENGEWVLNEIPNYAETLAKCQRYFYKATELSIPAYCVGNNNIRFELFCPANLRATPAVSISKINWVFQTDYNTNVAGTLNLNHFDGNALQCSVVLTSGSVNTGAVLVLIVALEVSADL